MEEWRSIPGLEGLYEASSLGRVRRIVYRNGYGLYPLAAPRIMKASPDPDGYFRVTITVDNRWTRTSVSALVCGAFHGPRPDGRTVAHEDGTRDNDVPGNLSWKTPLEQAADKHRHGTTARGENVGRAVLTAADVVEIRRRHRPRTGAALGREFGVTSANICAIIKRKTWNHV